MGKNVNFVTEGEDTEIDRNLVNIINDPLVHMVRNAVDHGIESPEEREAIRMERADQQEHASRETMSRWGREHGADYMLIGEINQIYDAAGDAAWQRVLADSYVADLWGLPEFRRYCRPFGALRCLLCELFGARRFVEACNVAELAGEPVEATALLRASVTDRNSSFSCAA